MSTNEQANAMWFMIRWVIKFVARLKRDFIRPMFEFRVNNSSLGMQVCQDLITNVINICSPKEQKEYSLTLSWEFKNFSRALSYKAGLVHTGWGI